METISTQEHWLAWDVSHIDTNISIPRTQYLQLQTTLYLAIQT